MSDDAVADPPEDAADGGNVPEGSALGETAAQKPDIGDEPDGTAAFKGSDD